jgi:hypothetical protein
MGTTWEHLDVVGHLGETDGFETCLPGAIQPPKLQARIVTKSFEEWAQDTNWDGKLAQPT